MSERVLEETCPECGYPTIEEKRKFKGEMLAVCTCLNPKCKFCDWQLPKELEGKEDPTESPLFDEGNEWAMEQASQIKHEFLSKQPLKVTVFPTANHVRDYLATLGLKHLTRISYYRIISRFLEWFEKEVAKA